MFPDLNRWKRAIQNRECSGGAIETSKKRKAEEVPEKESKPKTELQRDVIFVGRRPTMNYVLATVMQFNQGSEEVTVKARGRAISKAVDIAEIAMRRFLEGSIEVKDIKIGTDTLGEQGDLRNISTIEITLRKGA